MHSGSVDPIHAQSSIDGRRAKMWWIHSSEATYTILMSSFTWIRFLANT